MKPISTDPFPGPTISPPVNRIHFDTGKGTGLDIVDSITLNISSLKQTREFGGTMGRHLPRGAVCLFFGELAAGKTTLIKYICEGLGVPPEVVISPTYTITNIYRGAHPIYHVDFYRLDAGADLYNLDPDDWLNPHGPTFIEWPELALPFLEGIDALEARLKTVEGNEEQRVLSLSTRSTIYKELFRKLSENILNTF